MSRIIWPCIHINPIQTDKSIIQQINYTNFTQNLLDYTTNLHPFYQWQITLFGDNAINSYQY